LGIDIYKVEKEIFCDGYFIIIRVASILIVIISDFLKKNWRLKRKIKKKIVVANHNILLLD
jgi:hypothetical protein